MFNALFKQIQVTTGEVDSAKNVRELTDRPMHRWESALKFYSTILKLLLTLETLIREILNRGWANNAKLTHVYAAHWLKNNYPRDEYLMFAAIQYDFITEIVHFIKNTEFFETVEDVELNFKLLTVKKGECAKILKEFKEGKFVEWRGGGVEFNQQKWESMHQQVKDLYIDSWKERFDESNSFLIMFLFFSMTNFRSKVRSLDDTLHYGAEYIEMMKERFCRPVLWPLFRKNLANPFILYPLEILRS